MQEAVKPGDTDVVEAIDGVAHQLGCDAASSATGRSDVPAHATSTVPWPRGISPCLRRDRPRVAMNLHRARRAHGIVRLERERA